MIEKWINATENDGFIRFYWDGLTANGIGAGRIWFNAAGYSQLAGSRGLRRVLNTFRRKEIYLISHSRGASVVLSSIGDPVYDPDFLEGTREVSATWGAAYADFLSSAALEENENTLHFLALAPAIDRIDFCDASQQPEGSGPFECKELRDLSALTTFRYTVNSEDPVLNKFVGLSGNFNPTGLGTDRAIGERLALTYPFMDSYIYQPGNRFHSFGRYVQSEVFVKMLGDAQLLGGRSE